MSPILTIASATVRTPSNASLLCGSVSPIEPPLPTHPYRRGAQPGLVVLDANFRARWESPLPYG